MVRIKRKKYLKRTPIKKKSDRQKIIDDIITILRNEIKQERGDFCEVCGRNAYNLGLHHLLERSRCSKLIVHKENLILMCWNCHHNLHHYTHNHPKYKYVEEKIKQIKGEDYEEKLLAIDAMQCNMSLTYLKTYLLALKQVDPA